MHKHLSRVSDFAVSQFGCGHQKVQLPPGEVWDGDAESLQRHEGLHPRADHQVIHRDPQQVWQGHRVCTGQSHTGMLLNIVKKYFLTQLWMQ